MSQMMLKNTPAKCMLTRQRCRSMPLVVHCSASTVEPKTYAPPRERVLRDTALDAANSVPVQPRSFRRGPDGQQQSQQQQAIPKQLLPSLAFLEDDVSAISRKAKAMFPSCFATGNGVAVRCLGRQGAAGAMRYLLAIREEGAAAADERDVCIRIVPQEPVKHFGTPTFMIVTPVKGRMALPAEDSPLCAMVLSVSARTEPERLEASLFNALNNLERDHFVRLDMVGTDALYRGVSALRGAHDRISSASGIFFAVPELVSVPLRIRKGGQEQQQQSQQQEGADEAAAAETQPPPHVQVVRLYVGRSRSAPAPTGTGSGAASSSREARTDRSAAVTERPVNGKILVSEAELQELKGALGDMMEQQKLLAQLIGQQQAAAEGHERQGLAQA
ncbi:hypothetical protein Vretimale_1337 [Volvox reticuliferus]|uniref:Uncharacterized protein n=1 Tax=Volvox reticuliferus TaxID=1737510 RepID=A0A8J4D408_9CHLO|nr:hypothetical protein Vretifemale_10718 [Volvox reticuliferus]GIL95256.1 hypothetical protein Vretimale_1337 [Volvox reticuliferus]